MSRAGRSGPRLDGGLRGRPCGVGHQNDVAAGGPPLFPQMFGDCSFLETTPVERAINHDRLFSRSSGEKKRLPLDSPWRR